MGCFVPCARNLLVDAVEHVVACSLLVASKFSVTVLHLYFKR